MRSKKFSSIYGLLLGLAAVFGAFFIEGGTVKALFILPALLVVFGGTFAAVLIGFGFEKFKKIFLLIKLAYFPRQYDAKNLIDNMVEISIKGRKLGLLAAEKDLYKLQHPFSRKMIRLILDGMSDEIIENIAMTEMKAMQDRHFSNIFIFTKMGGYAPTMGIIGTVMGLIMTLANAGNDPNILIHNIASAFIATLWGILSANLLWLPVADRLKQSHLEEKHIMEVSFEGALAIQSGEIPTVIKSRLMSMLPQKEQSEMLAA